MLDIDNGARFETYAIPGGPGEVCLNGAAARLVQPGDRVIIITYADYDDAELDGYAPAVVHVDADNRPVDSTGRGCRPGRAAVGLTRRRSPRRRDRPARSGAATGGTPTLDLLVLGSGVAGLSAAVRAADTHGLRVGRAHQGRAARRPPPAGPRAASPPCSPTTPTRTDLHLADTLAAGAGLCDADAVRVLVDEGPGRVNELIALGAMFDRDEHGRLELAREGGHSLRPRRARRRRGHRRRDRAGAGRGRARAPPAALHENAFALDLLVEDGRCVGVVAPRRRRRAARRCGPPTCCSPPVAPASCSR